VGNINLFKVLFLSKVLVVSAMAANFLCEESSVEHSRKIALSASYVMGDHELSELVRLHNYLNCSPNQEGINDALYNTTWRDYRTIFRFLLSMPEGQRPDQNGINLALWSTARFNNSALFYFLLMLPEGSLRPNQDGINNALVGAVSGSHQSLVEFLLNRSDGQLRPEQTSVVSAYRIAFDYALIEMINLLEPYMTSEEVQNQMRIHGL
jgi:hypothetical protein